MSDRLPAAAMTVLVFLGALPVVLRGAAPGAAVDRASLWALAAVPLYFLWLRAFRAMGEDVPAPRRRYVFYGTFVVVVGAAVATVLVAPAVAPGVRLAVAAAGAALVIGGGLVTLGT